MWPVSCDPAGFLCKHPLENIVAKRHVVLGGDLGVRDEIQENYLPNLTEGRKKNPQYETAFKIPPHICGPNKNNISSALTLEFVGYVRVNFAR